jgi:hypothetical protein
VENFGGNVNISENQGPGGVQLHGPVIAGVHVENEDDRNLSTAIYLQMGYLQYTKIMQQYR